MPIDSSIPLQLKQIQLDNPMDVAAKAMTMKQLSMQNQAADRQLAETEALQSSLRKNTSIGANGRATVDKAGTLRDLSQVNPLKAMEMQKTFDQQDLESMKTHAEIAKQLAWSITDEPSYQRARAEGIRLGLPKSNELPAQYPGDGFIQKMQMTTRSAEERVADMWKEKEFNFKQQELNAKKDEAKGKATKDAATQTTELRKERSNLPTTKATAEVSSAYNKIQTAAKNPSAAGDLSLIFAYMKMLDPGSTVREGEFANAQNAAGVPDQVLNWYEKVRSGRRLGEDGTPQRSDFVKQAGGLYKSQMALQKQVDDRFSKLASKAGADPEDVLLNFEAQSPGGINFDEYGDDEIDRLYKEAGGK